MKLFKFFGSSKVNKAEEFIQEMGDEITQSNLQSTIEKGLAECWNELREQIDSEELYSVGVYCGNLGFGDLTFTANTVQGLREKVSRCRADDYYKDKTEEELSLSSKWNAADWKYHDNILSDHLDKASNILSDLTERMYSFEENDGEYELQEDVYDPGHELIYQSIISAITNFKSELSVKDEVVVGMFCGDASYDFLLQKSILVNKPVAIKLILKDLHRLGGIYKMNFLKDDYSYYN